MERASGDPLPCLLLQHREDLDDAGRGIEIRLALVAGCRVRQIAEVHRRRRRQREYEAGKREVGRVQIFHCRMLA